VGINRFVLAGLGALKAQAALRAVKASPYATGLERTNFRGGTVSLAGGPALAVSASVAGALGAGSAGTAAAVLTAGLGSGAVGLYDDIVGSRPEEKAYKGFKGHLRGLSEGRVTAGLVKIAGVGASALVASALLPTDRKGFGRAVDVALGAGVIAGSANLFNLLDLRPGRALKAGLLASGALTLTEPSQKRSRAQGDAGLATLSARRHLPARTRELQARVDALTPGARVVPLENGTRAGRWAGTSELQARLDALTPGALVVPLGNGTRGSRPARLGGLTPGARVARAGSAGNVAAGAMGAAAGLLAPDLNEEIMLGDTGANALGAVIGVAAAARTGRLGRAVLLAVLTGLTLASEKVSFTKVIEKTPVLREVDAWGRKKHP
jgi:UDP-N-acetylmuramyl pentapeptide phosphotransferase/UDP-N-acetylglucosamine-1-phosphate transferase